MRQHADRTAEEVATQISSGVQVISAIGKINDEGKVEILEVVIKKRPGSPSIDLRRMKVFYSSRYVDESLKYGGIGTENADNESFGIIAVRNSGTSENYILTSPEDMVEIIIDAGEIEPQGGLETAVKTRMELLPEKGYRIPLKIHVHPGVAGRKTVLLC